MARASIQRQYELNDARLRRHAGTRTAPVSQLQAQALVQRWLWILLGGLYLTLLTGFGSVFLAILGRISIPGRGADLAPVLFSLGMGAILAWIVMGLARSQLEPYLRDNLVVHLASRLGSPLPITPEQATKMLDITERPGTPVKDTLTQWLVENQAGVWTANEWRVVNRWEKRGAQIFKLHAKEDQARHQDSQVQALMADSEVSVAARAIKEQRALQQDTPQVQGAIEETVRRL